MTKRDKLLDKARTSPGSLRFEQLCTLAEAFGFQHSRSQGSHHIYQRDGYERAMNFQCGKNGEARGYQVKQLLEALIELGEIDEQA